MSHAQHVIAEGEVWKFQAKLRLNDWRGFVGTDLTRNVPYNAVKV